MKNNNLVIGELNVFILFSFTRDTHIIQMRQV